MKTNKKIITSNKDVETFLFCEKVKQQKKEFDERFNDLMSKEELKELEGGLKVLNLEEDEDKSHHLDQLNKFKDELGFNEDEYYTS